MNPVLHFKRVIPKGATTTLTLGNGLITPTVSGGWGTTARDRRLSITEFVGGAPASLDIPVLFDGLDGEVSQESDILAMYDLLLKIVGDDEQPYVYQVSGVPLPVRGTEWVVNGIAMVDEIRRASDGDRVQGQYTVTIMQYIAPDLLEKTPARKAVKQGDGSPSSKSKATVYIVKKGDNLKSIAAKLLGNPNDWHAIAKMNGDIRDPNSVKPGQKLKIPAHA